MSPLSGSILNRILLGCMLAVSLLISSLAQPGPFARLPLTVSSFLAGVWVCILVVLIWREVAPWLVPLLAKRTAQSTRSTPRAFGRKYHEQIWYRNREFDVRGLVTLGENNLDQDEVFVELRLSPKPPQEASRNPLARHEIHEPEVSRNIWTYLQTPRRSLWEVLLQRQRSAARLVILGVPGSGKTTLLKHVALTFTGHSAVVQRKLPRSYVPIILFLRNHIGALKSQPHYGLADLVSEHVRDQWSLQPPTGWFAEKLERGRCIVLLDGLDEVANTQDRQLVVQWVQEQMARYINTPFLITSRPAGYVSNPLSGVRSLNMQPFGPEQVEHFIRRWYRANELMRSLHRDQGVEEKARSGANDLLLRLSKIPALTDLTVNPLLLTMITTVHRYRGKLPGRRVDLYREICEVFLSRRKHNDWDLAPLQMQRVLEALAYAMMRSRQAKIRLVEAEAVITRPLEAVSAQTNSAAFIAMIEESSGLLIEREAGVYSFAHLTFQEYLAAVHIQRNRLESELDALVEDDWWHEAILLYAAQEDASSVLKAAIELADRSTRALNLAIKCLDEAAAIRPELRRIVKEALLADDQQNNEEWRAHRAQALLMLSLQDMAILDEHNERRIGSSLISVAIYQEFLRDQSAAQRHYHPDHWGSETLIGDQGREPMLGVRPDDALAFCAWVSSRDPEGCSYRLPTQSEARHWWQQRSGRYWTFDSDKGFSCEGSWLSSSERVRAYLAAMLTADLRTLRHFFLGYIMSELAELTSDLTSSQRPLSLPEYQDTNDRVAHLLRLGGKLAESLRAPEDRANEPPQNLTLIDTFAYALDQSELVRERLLVASEAARQSYLARQRGVLEDIRSHSDSSDYARNEARTSMRRIADAVRALRGEMALLQRNQPTHLLSQSPFAQELHNLLRSGQDAEITDSLAGYATAVAEQVGRAAREHVFILSGKRFDDYVKDGVFCLPSNVALEAMKLFEHGTGVSHVRPGERPVERSALRCWGLLCALIWTQRLEHCARPDQKRFQTAQIICRSLYIDLVLLEARLKHVLPPVEGIRLVREPRNAASPAL